MEKALHNAVRVVAQHQAQMAGATPPQQRVDAGVGFRQRRFDRAKGSRRSFTIKGAVLSTLKAQPLQIHISDDKLCLKFKPVGLVKK